MTYHLIAFATNCVSIERAEIEWTLATRGLDGEWYQWDGQLIYPFHVVPIDIPEIEIPPGWIDHIQSTAARDVRQRAKPSIDLASMMGLNKPAQPAKPFARRI